MKTILFDSEDLIDFELYGLITSYNDSPQLIYHLNRFFETRFERCNDLDVVIDGHLTYFPVFEWENPETGEYYNIIKNVAYTVNQKNNGNSLSALFDLTPALISRFKEYNFLMKATGDGYSELPISENQFIQKISRLKTEKVKSIERLIF